MSRSLIEQWLPTGAIGAESIRERSTFTALPPLFALHVWWARRPLIASRAAVLASLLPAWPSDEEAAADSSVADLLAKLQSEFPGGELRYRAWFLKLVGIRGDPVAGRAAIKAANLEGVKLAGNGYGYPRAFTCSPDKVTLESLYRLVGYRLGDSSGRPVVLDPFAGGGSIPFEATRYRCEAIANELNPVAAAILEATVSLPATLGSDFADLFKAWGTEWASRIRTRLQAYFPKEANEKILGYIWAHTVPCPTTGRPTPLVPDFWLARGKAGRDIAVALEADHVAGSLSLRVISGTQASHWGNRATYKRGTAESVWTGETFSGEYIRGMAAQKRIGHMLLAICFTNPESTARQFRIPTPADLEGVAAAESEAAAKQSSWEIDDLVPSEFIPPGSKTDEPRRMGLERWSDFFTPRQLLTHITALEELKRLTAEARGELGDERARALALYLAIALDKAVNFNGVQSRWQASQMRIRGAFDRHDFAFKWTFAEFDGADALTPWVVDQVDRVYAEISRLVAGNAGLFEEGGSTTAKIFRGSATALPIASSSVDVVVTDPPYYDNVMYAECSDYFYVWLKRSLEGTWPDFTDLVLTDKQNEAVANAALFKDVAIPVKKGSGSNGGRSAVALADQHYEKLLTASFREAHRVLKPNGVLTVMFTHKRIDAWDTLGVALLDAGFSIDASWPIHTEFENALNQAKKNAATSTIFLACRKRISESPAYWADIRSDVEKAAEAAADRFSAEGMTGVDLTIATYGPVLSVLSDRWPVYTGELNAGGGPEVLRPDAALDLAREKVASLKKRGLLGGRDVEFDRVTDWYLLAWSDFRAAEFPFDEARKLCIATHLEFDDLSRRDKIVKATSGSVTLLTPAQRRTAGGLDPDASSFNNWIDRLHVLMLIYDEDGLPTARAWLAQTGMGEDSRFADLLQAALTAIPRVKDKGQFVRPEARILDSLRTSLFDQIPAPVDATAPQANKGLFEIEGELGFSLPGQLGYEEEEAVEGAE